MLRRSFLTSMAGAIPFPSGAATANPPNVLFILTDDQGWYELGANGNPHIETPNLDRLASQGVRFTNFCASPVCSPTRASLMTGRHYQRTGAIDTFMGRDTLAAGEVTLGQILQDRGYRTGCVGKWHLGRYMRYHPNERGFDEYFGFWQYGFINRYDDPDELYDNNRPAIATGYITDVLTDRAITFLERNQRNPFFLYLPYNAPHSPDIAPDRYVERYLSKGLPLDQARIYGMISSVDANVGRLLGTLDRMGLASNTAVFFMTDNGGVSRHFKAGLRGFKGSVFEGGVRVPLLARFPGRFPAGAVAGAMGQHIDLFPTIAELTGARMPGDRALDGRSLLPVLTQGGGATRHSHLYHQWNRVRPALEGNAASWAIRDAAGWKLHHDGSLYRLNEDAGEARNLAATETVRADRMRVEFTRWFGDVTAGQSYERVPIEIGRPDENPVEIDLTWAEPSGGVEPFYRHYNRDTIEKWHRPEDSLSWKLDAVRAGRYRVWLQYGCAPGAEGSRIRIEAGRAACEYEVEATAGRSVFRQFSAGTLDLAAGPQRFVMRAPVIRAAEPMLLHRIYLERE